MASFSAENMRQGRENQMASQETPESFGSIDGASAPRPTGDLDQGSSRMAGKMGARALTMINNPVEQQRTMNWMQKFGMSNQGMQWNQAKMMMMQPPAPPQ